MKFRTFVSLLLSAAILAAAILLILSRRAEAVPVFAGGDYVPEARNVTGLLRELLN